MGSALSAAIYCLNLSRSGWLAISLPLIKHRMFWQGEIKTLFREWDLPNASFLVPPDVAAGQEEFAFAVRMFDLLTSPDLISLIASF